MENWSSGIRARMPMVFVAMLAGLLGAVAAAAQGSGRSMDFDTSVRSLGMGGACTGVAWGDADVWGNVASLAMTQGVRWEHGRAQLVPGLAADVCLRTNRLLLGERGFGIALLGVPGARDGVRLDYGMSEATDVNGNPTGSFNSYESVRGWALAASASGVARCFPDAPAWIGKGIDVTAGVARKSTHVVLAPAYSGEATANTYDWGVQARLSPVPILAAATRLPAGPVDYLVCDVGFGCSVINAGGESFRFPNEDLESPATRMRRRGIAFRLGVHAPSRGLGRWAGSIMAGLDPLVSVAQAYDHDDDGAGNGPVTYTVAHSGIECTFANVFFLRRGHWTDRAGDIDGPTRGWGVGLPLGPWAGWRYDKCTVPQARDSGLPDVKHVGWTLWIEPLRIARDLKLLGH